MREITIKEYLKRRIIFCFKEYDKMPTLDWLYSNINKKELASEMPVRVSYDKLNSELSYLIVDKFLILKKGEFQLNPNKNFISNTHESDILTKSKTNKTDTMTPEMTQTPKEKYKELKKTNMTNAESETLKNIKLKQLLSKLQKEETPDESMHHEPAAKKRNWQSIVSMCVLLFIGTGSAYMSIYYSHIWLVAFLDTYRALLLALIMVCFAIAAFELIIFFKRDKKYSLVVVFSFLWAVVTFFSMVSTIAGQYNARIGDLTKRYNQENEISIAAKKENAYKEQKQEYKNTLAMLRKRNTHYQSLLFQYDTPEKITDDKKMYNSLSYNSRITSNKINKTITKMDDLDYNKGTKHMIKKVPLDFYVWMSNLTGITPEMVQFWLSIFPAIFIDLMAPFSFAIVLFSRQAT